MSMFSEEVSSIKDFTGQDFLDYNCEVNDPDFKDGQQVVEPEEINRSTIKWSG